MPVYVHLCKGTTEGFKTIKDVGARYEAMKKGIEALGGKLLSSYALLGRYDYLLVAEYPSGKAALEMSLKAASRGTVGLETLEALPIDEFFKIVKKL